MENNPYKPPEANLKRSGLTHNTSDNTMRVEFETTFKDILTFSASHQIRNIPMQVLYFMLCLIIFFSEYTYENQSVMSAFMIAFGWYIGLWLFQFAFNAFYLYSRKNKSVLTKHIVELHKDAFYEETPYNKSYFYWNGIVKVLRFSGFIAVYVTPHNAVIIPYRAFSDKEERALFIRCLDGYMKTTT